MAPQRGQRTSVEAAATGVDEPAAHLAVSESRPQAMSEDDVRKRAYELYCERGFEDGHDVDDWLQAEDELNERDQ